MHRSEINEIIAQADAFIGSHGYILPPFAYWSPDKMRGLCSFKKYPVEYQLEETEIIFRIFVNDHLMRT
jgi:D-lyxose ketol-isomerase